MFSNIQLLIENIDNEDKEMYLLGDLNCNLLDKTNQFAQKLLSIMETFQLSQQIEKPTRITSSSSSLLDVCITTSPEKVSNSGVIHVGFSDHSLIYIIRKINIPTKTKTIKEIEIRNFKKFNKERFLYDLQLMSWEQVDNKEDVNAMWTCFKDLFLKVLDKHAPLISKRVKTKSGLPWVTKDIREQMKERDRLKRTAVINNEERVWNLYKSSKNAVNIALRKAKKEYYKTQIQNQSGDPKRAWRTVNNILGRKHPDGGINEITVDNKPISSPGDIAQLFNDYFINIGPKLASSIVSDCSYSEFLTKVQGEFCFKLIEVSQIRKLFNSLSLSKATGIDRISAKILKLASPIISKPIAEIINRSIVSQIFPNEWKIAKVIPLHKKGPRNVLDNYRPISILPVVSKVYEKILYEQLIEYFNAKKLLSDNQFGFRRFHSTASALLDCTNEWYVNMDRGLYNLAVFLDLKKAFDTVDHEILLGKLVAYGIKGHAIKLLSSYLDDRRQLCQVNGKISSLEKIKCGVPQGSILGPLLFLAYINDLPNCLKFTTPRLFADDTSLTAVGISLPEIEVGLNYDLDNVRKWLTANKLSLNIAKTEYTLIASRNKINSLTIEPNVMIGNSHINRVHDCKTLGVYIDESLTWQSHINEIAKKISSGIGAIKRLRDYVNRDTLVSVYNALVQPHFDYCCEVWDSLGAGLSLRLQKLQNRCARVIMRYKNESGESEKAMNALGWVTLAERRAQIKAKFMFKVLHSLAPTRLSAIFKESNATTCTYSLRNTSKTVALPLPKTDFLKKSISYSGAKLWNSLPNELRNCDSLSLHTN